MFAFGEQPAPDADAAGMGSRLAEVSREMVGLYKEQFGRGPTKARSHFAGPDILLCLLENSFTPAEHSLISMNRIQAVRETRMVFQYANEQVFRDSVERIMGRRVLSFISGVDASTDTSLELFVLEPSGNREAVGSTDGTASGNREAAASTDGQ